MQGPDRCRPCDASLRDGPFKIGDRVRCHADCRWDPDEPDAMSGVLVADSHLGAGWFDMRPDDPLSCLGIGTTVVHEQELERLG